MKGRTVIMIAHRLSTIRDSDLIIVLKDGVVAEQGSHDELMRKNGVYAELYHIQYGAPVPKAAPAASVA
jgi:ABC-type multidrug transport system fused ATPase/permease subunit